ncbi:MAG: 30S ribosomal protein S12 methylthiotransferase RimO [Peptococcaceae bacterium]|jgi:ribosomal protein S12 methylthiotransferase|nr:30S ribosomal protein S12 methylthiotransferase RimO [Peptococcaceae bacterium]
MPAVFVVSLGCSKNLVDSEIMLGLAKEGGYVLAQVPEEADAIIVNTCGFILSAKKEAIETILEMAQYKETGRCRALLVTGCMVSKYQEELAEAIPEVDGFLHIDEYAQVVSVLNQLLNDTLKGEKSHWEKDLYLYRHLTTPKHTAFLRVADGCNNHCTFCIIPQLRGRYISRPMEDILAEARQLYEAGVKEIILIAQDTTNYGIDLYGERKIAELLDKVSDIPFFWVRMLYAYPDKINEQLLAVMAQKTNICHYLDIPFQHSHDDILKRMGRKSSQKQLQEVLQKCRDYLPDIALRSTFMVGFPGEDKRKFDHMLHFLKDAKLDWVGVFQYCPEEGTPSAKYPHQVREGTKEKRYIETMELLAGISAEGKKRWLGQDLPVIIEELPTAESPFYMARSQYHAPEVDGVVWVNSEKPLSIGDIVTVHIIDSEVYDITGEVR